jgi:hypothetical protein
LAAIPTPTGCDGTRRAKIATGETRATRFEDEDDDEEPITFGRGLTGSGTSLILWAMTSKQFYDRQTAGGTDDAMRTVDMPFQRPA